MTGVASTRTRPLPIRGAVCSSPTSSSAWPSRPGWSLDRSVMPGSLMVSGHLKPAKVAAGTDTTLVRRLSQTLATQLESSESHQPIRQGSWMANAELTRIDQRPIPDNFQEIRAFMMVWNESIRLESTLRHYRQLGVHRFFVVDLGSTDGTLD